VQEKISGSSRNIAAKPVLINHICVWSSASNGTIPQQSFIFKGPQRIPVRIRMMMITKKISYVAKINKIGNKIK
jgi:hypothetical protein